MRIYLMRHADAVEGDQMDRRRSLTDLGRQQCDDIRKFFKTAGITFDAVYTSPFARTLATAALVAHDGVDLWEVPDLEPDVTAEDAWLAIHQMIDGDPEPIERVLIVGHGPLLQAMLAAVCFGFAQAYDLFDKGSVAFIHDGVFRWFVTPRLAEKLRESERKEFATAGVSLSEHLMHRSVRKVVDPLIAQVRKRVAARFMTQRREIEFDGHSTVLWGNPKLKVFDALAKRAYVAGAMQANGQLGWVQEAKTRDPKWLALLPGITRLASSVEADLDRTTADQIGTIVQQMRDEGATEAVVLKALKRQFRDWANGEDDKMSRAERIAETEISTAYHHGMRDVALQVHRGGNGPVEKSWDAQPDACPMCEANSQEGWIDVEAPFTSGHFEPPGHPACRCSLSYRTIE